MYVCMYVCMCVCIVVYQSLLYYAIFHFIFVQDTINYILPVMSENRFCLGVDSRSALLIGFRSRLRHKCSKHARDVFVHASGRDKGIATTSNKGCRRQRDDSFLPTQPRLIDCQNLIGRSLVASWANSHSALRAWHKLLVL